MLSPARIATILGRIHNPCLLFCSGNGSLTAYERVNPTSGDGRKKALSMTGSGAVRYKAASGARTNYFPNPQLGTNATGWVTAGSATSARTADTEFASGQCYESAATASTLDGFTVTAQMRDVSLSAATITVGVAAKVTAGATDWQARAQLVDAAGSAIGSAGSFVDLVPGATVARAVLTITNPTQVGGMGVSIQVRRKTAASSTIRVSDLTIESGSTTGTWFTPVWLDYLSGYLGTAHASPSVSQAVFWPWEGVTNVDCDPVFGNASITAFHALAGSATIAKVTTFGYLGSAAGEVVCTASTSDGIDYLTTGGSAASNGQSWTFNGHIRAKASGDVGKTVVPVIYERASDNSIVKTNTGSAITLTDAPQEFSYTVTLAGGGTVAKVTWGLKNGAASACSFELLDKQLAQKAYATPVAAGSLGTGHAWSGTAHASSSTRTAMVISTDDVNRLNPRRGSLFGIARFDAAANGSTNHVVFDWTSTVLDRLTVYRSTDGFIKFIHRSNGDSTTVVSSGVSVGANSTFTYYLEWNRRYISIVVNGTTRVVSTRTSDVTGALGSSNPLKLGESNINVEQAGGSIGPFLIFDSALTAAELAKLVALGPAANWSSIVRAA